MAGLVAVPLADGRTVAAGFLLAVAAGLTAALLFIRWDDLAELFAPITPDRSGSNRSPI
jgi:ABC-type nitrate/sulfonate/bicarbonate transport system permease component